MIAARKNAGSSTVFSIAGSPPTQRAPGGHNESEPEPENASPWQSVIARDPLCMSAKMSTAPTGMRLNKTIAIRRLDEIRARYLARPGSDRRGPTATARSGHHGRSVATYPAAKTRLRVWVTLTLVALKVCDAVAREA